MSFLRTGTSLHPSSALRADPQSLRANFSWTFAGNVFYAMAQWALLVLIARLGSEADLGLFALATAISSPIVIFSNLKLRAVQASDALDDFEFGTYLAVRLTTALLGFAVTLGLVMALGYVGKSFYVIMMVTVAKIIESISDIFYGLQQRHERMDVVAKSLMLKGVLSLVGFTAGWFSVGSLQGGVVGLALAWLASLALFDIPQSRALCNGFSIQPVWSIAAMRRLVILALPLGFTVAIASVASNVPKYFIEHQMTTADLGVFAALSYLLVAGNLVISAIGQSATPRLSQFYRRGNPKAHLVLTGKLLALGGGLGVLGVGLVLLLGPMLLRTLYGKSYAAYSDVLVWLMVAAGIGYAYVFLGTALTSMKKFNVQLPIHIAGLVVLVLSAWILIPRSGLLGAAYALLVANLFQACGYGVLFRRYLGIQYADAEKG